MAATTEQIPAGYVSADWTRLKTGSYVDRGMLSSADGSPLTNINAYQGHLALKRLGLRSIDDREFNELVNADPQVAKQMRSYGVWTSFLKDIQSNAKEGGYTAKHIARPDVSFNDGEYAVKGNSKPTRLPDDGWFTVSHILSSDDGLPHETTPGMPDEACAHWAVAKGQERPVLRGGWGEPGQFRAHALWESLLSLSGVGVRGASDSEVQPIVFAGIDALREIEQIGERYGLTPAEVVAELGKRL